MSRRLCRLSRRSAQAKPTGEHSGSLVEKRSARWVPAGEHNETRGLSEPTGDKLLMTSSRIPLALFLRHTLESVVSMVACEIEDTK
jgi:hypothetical protein